MSNLRFIGHTGEIRNLRRLHAKSMFVFDANAILTMLGCVRRNEKISPAYNAVLMESRARVHLHWQVREKYLPVDPVLGIMELTKQDLALDYPAYLNYFNSFFSTLYRVTNYDPRWVSMTYEAGLPVVKRTHHSVARTIHQVLLLAPKTGGLKPPQILQNIEQFLSWALIHHEELEVMGGPLLHLAVYAIAGEPSAHRFLKLARLEKDGVASVSRNVAWDIMHWINLDLNYYYGKYQSTVVCTADQALGDFLLMRRNMGPRGSSAMMTSSAFVESFGTLKLPNLSKIEGTNLGAEINQLLLAFWQRLIAVSKNENIFFAPQNLS
ncbi:hypothetical protein [Rhodoferax sp.]|uniref:hypothetical protein n=1 Tax=Rhodoferax sp. TaxID=50421 RepID=UPI0025F20905|nr:hypothetical protein [Rhodoferax sp.]